MNNAKHTPGPWHLSGAYSEMNAERPYDITAGFCLIATTCPQSRQRYESLANARLIAAAPDLLEALIKLSNEVIGTLPLMEPFARREFGNSNYTILIQRAEEARVAIAKAERAMP